MQTQLDAATLDDALLDSVRRGRVVIPPFPAVAARLHRLIWSSKAGARELAGIIEKDQVLAAETVRRANAADLAARGAVASIPSAVKRLGTQELLRMAYAITLGGVATREGSLHAVREALWRDALLVAYTSDALATGRGDGGSPVFLAGLLHDFARLVALTHAEQLMKTHDGPARSAWDWVRLVDQHRAQVAELVVREWAIPPPIVGAVLYFARSPAHTSADLSLVPPVLTAIKAVSLWHKEPAPTVEAIARATQLDARASALLLHRLPEIVSGVVAFGELATPARSAAPSSKVVPAEATAPVHRWPVGCPVRLVRKGQPDVPYVAEAVTPQGVVLRGAEPLRESALVRLWIEWPPGPFEMFGHVTLVHAESASSCAEIRPFGLGGDAKQAWSRLLREAQAQQAHSPQAHSQRAHSPRAH
ncbi:MAG: HDOD domain-containing protein [Deltaproteobacteria bacterium]|nr:HDOD domain-containing protein [Deltaproteobacteria bacterium]